MGTHPIFESDFDCLTENRIENGRSLQHFLPNGASPVQVRWYWSCRYNQVGVDGQRSSGLLCQLHWTPRCFVPHSNCRKRVPSSSSVQHAEENVSPMWPAAGEAQVD